MSKQEAIKKAKYNLARTPLTQVIIRRGEQYDVHSISSETKRGWKVSEMISLDNVHNF